MDCIIISFYPLPAGMDGEDGCCGKGESLNLSLVTLNNMLFHDHIECLKIWLFLPHLTKTDQELQ